MIRSMTGFGDASCTSEGISYSVELRSLNNRYLKATIRVPDELLGIEAGIEAQLRKLIHRGSVTAIINLKDSRAEASAINEKTLNEYMSHLKSIEMRAAEEMAGHNQISIDLGALLMLPGVIEPPDQSVLFEKAKPVLTDLVDTACEKLKGMRASEGEALCADLRGHLEAIAAQVDSVAERAPSVVDEYHQRLKTRVEELMAKAKLQLHESDLAKEVAVYAERCDISEEIQRLRSHLEHFEEILASDEGEPAGRTLDFITQELLREANTIGSKSNDATISRHVVQIKGLIDRVKEQVQNVE
ncbi:MAG: YicC/YloC family endoribonuclease [Planctomycetota bacterium]|jgi:uncharacterized protein (TIGR00255 family)